MPEKIIIGISVENKIASVADKNAVIVCGNSNYKAVFAFDSEWENYKVKTALFATENGDNGTIAVVFEGNECDIPPLTNTTIVGVGVVSGDLTQGEEVESATTAPAYIDCLLSIKDLGGVIAPPAPDVYDQIIALLNKYIQQGGGGSGETGGGLTEAEVKEIVQSETEGLQPKVDDGLETESKSVVGAINETNSKALATVESSIADGTYSVKLVFQNDKGEAIAETTLDLPLSEFVKFTDYATESKAGVVKVTGMFGIGHNENIGLHITQATWSHIEGKKNQYSPITSAVLDYAVKVGVTTNTEKLTDEEKQAVASWIGTQAQNKPNTLVQRYGSGNIAVPLVPTSEVHATSKKYVDDNFIAKPTTDEEKAAACETIGALPLSGGRMTGEIKLAQGDNNGINLGAAGVINSGTNTVLGFLYNRFCIGSYNIPTVIRTSEKKLKVQFGLSGSTNGNHENLATEKYVDDNFVAKPASFTGGARVLSISASGETGALKYSSAPSSDCIPVANSKGNIKTNTPEADLDCANKKYVDDGFLAKPIATGLISWDVIAKTMTSMPTTFSPMAYGIPRYSNDKSIKTSTPLVDEDCTNKAYVDGKIAELLARIEALENK